MLQDIETVIVMEDPWNRISLNGKIAVVIHCERLHDRNNRNNIGDESHRHKIKRNQ